MMREVKRKEEWREGGRDEKKKEEVVEKVW